MKHTPHLIPDISEPEIQNQSKADNTAKALLLSQVVYFCVSLIIRGVHGLPVSLLEVTTIAHSLCTILTYAFWWGKPLDIQLPKVLSDTGGSYNVTAICALLLMNSKPGTRQSPNECQRLQIHIATCDPLQNGTTVVDLLQCEVRGITLKKNQALQIEGTYFLFP